MLLIVFTSFQWRSWYVLLCLSYMLWSAIRFKSMVCCRFFALETNFSWKYAWSFSSKGANVEGCCICQSVNDIPVWAVRLSGFSSVIDRLTWLFSASPLLLHCSSQLELLLWFSGLSLGFFLELLRSQGENSWARVSKAKLNDSALLSGQAFSQLTGDAAGKPLPHIYFCWSFLKPDTWVNSLMESRFSLFLYQFNIPSQRFIKSKLNFFLKKRAQSGRWE